MPTENRKILIRRGTGSPPSDVVAGELLLRTDTDGIATNKVFIGTGTGTAKAIANLTDMGVTATSTHLNFVSGASSNIQGQLNGKAALAGADFTGAVTVQAPSTGTNPTTKTYVDTELALKANLAGPNLSGTPTAPTAAAGTNTTQLATTAFVQGAVASVSAGVSGVNVSSDEINTLDDVDTSTTVQAQLDAKVVPGDLEWQFVQKITGSGDTLSITNSSITNENFDIANYDYKFIVDLDTTAEDNDFPKIRLNNVTGSEYASLYRNITLDAVTNPDNGVSNSFGGYDRTSVETGLQLTTENQDVALTALSLEFVVSQSLAGYTFGNTTVKALMVQGIGNALAIDAPSGTPKVWPVTSRFNGSLSSSAGLTQVDVIHFISAGPTDNSVVRIYKRAK